jgi:Ca-activated chloride channel family protein
MIKSLSGYSFANPVFIYLLPLFALLVAMSVILKIKRSPSLGYPVAASFKARPTLLDKLVKWLPFSLYMAALLLCLVALARPRLAGKAISPYGKGIDIILTMDTSASMLAEDLKPSRLIAAKETAESFVAGRSGDRIGVVAFAGGAFLQCPLTLDYDAAADYIKTLDISKEQGTALGDAIAVSAKHLKDSSAKSKVIILVTDGESNAGTIDPVLAARAAASYGVKIYAIGVSGEGHIMAPQISQNALATLKEIAAITGAGAYRARDNADLRRIYEEIDALEKTDFKENVIVGYEDKYKPFLELALAFLIISFIFDKVIFTRIP